MIAIKSPSQIDGIRRSCQLAARTLVEVGKLVRPGVTTDQLNDAAAQFMKAHGATPATLNYISPAVAVPFPKESCISVNEVICHGISSDQVLKEGDVVKVDVTTILDGYYGDTCKTFAVGSVSKKAAALMRCGEECLEIGVKEVAPGKHLHDIGFHIANYAHAHGYSVVKAFSGHGVGLAFHEEPNVPHFGKKGTGPVMQPGMIFTIEPMVSQGRDGVVIDAHDHWTARTVDGKLSVQNEHTILVTETGVEILTLP
jgi:methionyl aminopeptidase